MTYTPSDGPMSTSYTDLADGDDSDVASVEVWLEALSDSMEYMRLHGLKQVFGTEVSVLPDSLTVTRTVRSFGAIDSTRLVVVPGVSPVPCVIPLSDIVRFPLMLPQNAELNTITVRVNPADDALPTTNISLGLVRITHADGTTTNVASSTDPLTGASYQAEHNLVLDLSGAPPTIDNELYSYILRISGESGGDTDDVVLVSAPTVTYDLASLDLAGA